MSHYPYSGESRLSIYITPAIARGEPWTARHLSNNNLRQHCHSLARIFRGPHPLTQPIRDPCARLLAAIEEKCNLLTRVHPSEYQLIPVLTRISAYAEKWIRQPETWSGDRSEDPRAVIRSLLGHLFMLWEVPEFFDNAWLVKGELRYLERDWYCHFALGGSLRKVRGMPPSITSRALHLAMRAPRDLTIRQALRWGQVRSSGGGEEWLAEVSSSRMVRDLSNDAIWSRLLEKLIRAKDFDPGHFGLIADTLIEVMEREHVSRAESLTALPLDELLRYSRRYWRTLLRLVRIEMPGSRNDINCRHLRAELHQMNGNRWACLPRSRTFESVHEEGGMSSRFRIVELTHQWQLVAESRAMKHCIHTYGRACKAGRCSIFSVRQEETVGGRTITTSHLTIEVDRRSRRILQTRGRRNRLVTAREIPMLRKWADAIELTFPI
ncbi:PcfJ domain-containing protein [Luteolibacter yonseiensis]|uniref:PcfJ domain-containing protein n=1 Tax=Luteolibacter yonseiensis TaxID=1144680 RepID=A0A934R1A2_9BACT|nr:PcfJ domain-containing protein [Luteolibacter yonseiensis]MBK1814652.1 PcfJ domain-containing protein [Luteolibacter yonseiensis]